MGVACSWAMVDCFAIPMLLFLAMDPTSNADPLPAFKRDLANAATTIEQPVELILSTGQLPTLDDQPVTWEQLPTTLSQLHGDQLVTVTIQTAADGSGPVNQVMRLSVLATENRFAEKLVFLSESSPNSDH